MDDGGGREREDGKREHGELGPTLASHATPVMTVRKNNKKSHPTYILLTAEEQLSITLTLLNFSSLARGMLRPSGVQDKFSQGRRGTMGLGSRAVYHYVRTD
jgi:hypothetical protein